MTRAAAIKRNGRKTKARTASRKKAVRSRRSIIDAALARLPVDPARLDRWLAHGAGIGLAMAATILLWIAGFPQWAGHEAAQIAGRMGFAVKRVEVTGIERMERLTVYAVALDQHSTAMPLVDLEKVRKRLLTFGWIEDARVSRRLPDTLVVDIVERKPAAIWQRGGRLSLIDAKGRALEGVGVGEVPDLPLLVGTGANRAAPGWFALVERAPSLKPSIVSATWVGGRRWDVHFASGETLALPEGDELAGKALIRFARMDGVQRLLGRGFARFDMRDPDRFVARVRKDRPAIDEAPGDAGKTKEGEKPDGAA